jgi:DNA-binding PadR family transcriptional regulator
MSSAPRPRAADGRRKPYSLTDAGRDEVRRQLEAMETVVRTARWRLERPAPA